MTWNAADLHSKLYSMNNLLSLAGMYNIKRNKSLVKPCLPQTSWRLLHARYIECSGMPVNKHIEQTSN